MFLSIVLPRVHTITKLRGKVAIQPEGFSCRLSENAPTVTLLEVWQGIKRNLMKRLGIQNTKKWKWNCWICISFDTLKDWGCNLQACWNIGLQNFAAFLLLVHAIIYLFSNPVRKLWNFPLETENTMNKFLERQTMCYFHISAWIFSPDIFCDNTSNQNLTYNSPNSFSSIIQNLDNLVFLWKIARRP